MKWRALEMGVAGRRSHARADVFVGVRFFLHRSRLRNRLPDRCCGQRYHVNAKFFDQLPACIMAFVEMRNAVEHPGGHSGSLITENIALTNGRELVAPRWHREKEGKITYGPLPIIEDMSVAVNNLLILAEDVVVMWGIDHLVAPSAMRIVASSTGKARSWRPSKGS